jgi:2,5-dichloro-2,5-cyclohexadiene-1,4-diol dehydrogenase 1
VASLKGKSLIITGGASGIGRAAVLRAAADGARITIADMDESRGERTCNEALERGADAQFVRTDVSRREDVEKMVQAAVGAYGRLDGAFNNAGVPNHNQSIADLTVEQFEKVAAINYTGVFLCMKFEIAEMLKSGGGSIVNTASTAAVVTLPNMFEYTAAKAGVCGMTRAAAIDLARKNIRVNAVLPGLTRTLMVEEGMKVRPATLVDEIIGQQPLGRILEPDEIAAAACWLLSDDASAVTGISMPVDGGLSVV